MAATFNPMYMMTSDFRVENDPDDISPSSKEIEQVRYLESSWIQEQLIGLIRLLEKKLILYRRIS